MRVTEVERGALSVWQCHEGKPIGDDAGSEYLFAMADGRRAHAATVVGVVVAGVLASIVVPGPYDFGSTMIGLTLLAVLFGYGDAPDSVREAIGFSAAVSICLLLVIGVFLDRFLNVSGWPTPNDESQRWTLDQATPWWTNGFTGLLVWATLGLLTFASWVVWRRRREAGKPLPERSHDSSDSL